MLAVRYDTGALFKITRSGRISEVALDRSLVGGDGMDLRPDGSLAVVTNSLGAPGEAAVSVLRSSDNWATARTTHRAAPWGDDEPTTIARSTRRPGGRGDRRPARLNPRSAGCGVASATPHPADRGVSVADQTARPGGEWP